MKWKWKKAIACCDREQSGSFNYYIPGLKAGSDAEAKG